ncbi:MAG: hypothetical protein JNL83_34720 [Myxococcales bacterium]|nr:hypothetical protein [Myxococcales bacterium]
MAKHPTTERSGSDSLEPIDLTALEAVTGGRISRSSQPDPAVLAGIKQLGELIAAVGQQLVAARQQGPAQLMQMMQQMMQIRGGR